MFRAFFNWLLKIQVMQVTKIKINPDEYLLMVIRNPDIDVDDLVNLKKMISENLPELASRVMIVCAYDEIEVKSYALSVVKGRK
jgi:hypothetical protein